MHELSVCQALLEQVEALVRRHEAHAACRITVRVGALSGVVPELLAQAFPLVRSIRPATAEAELVIETVPVRVRCERCGAQSEVAINRLLCAACGDWRTQLISGDELMLVSVELIRAERSETSEAPAGAAVGSAFEPPA